MRLSGFSSAVFTAFWLQGLILSATPGPTSTNEGFSIRVGAQADSFILEWYGRDSYVYFVEHSDDLMQWTYFPVYELGSNAPLSWGLSTAEERIFFRLRSSNDPDSTLLATDYNGAQLGAWDQIQLGYNPFDWVDTNLNSVHDAWEQYHFADLMTAMAADLEPDGLSNASEFAAGTDPNQPDHPDLGLLLF